MIQTLANKQEISLHYRKKYLVGKEMLVLLPQMGYNIKYEVFG